MIQNKHIIRLSFIGLFLNIIASIILYRYFMIEKIILEQSESQNRHLADIYKKSIWNNNLTAIKKINNNHYKNLLQDPDFLTFIRQTDSFLEEYDAYITIYDSNANKIFINKDDSIIAIKKQETNFIYKNIVDNLDHYFLEDYVSDFAINAAFKGKISSSLKANVITTDINNDQDYKSFITTYVPIFSMPDDGYRVSGMFEITSDITEQWNYITHLEKRIFISFIIVFFVFFIIVMYNTNYAQKIINKQFESNRELQRAIKRAEMESRAKTEFLAKTSHELRTPLNAIIGFSEIMAAETYGKILNKNYKEYVADINQSGKHLLAVINDILDFSKASADRLTVDKVELDLNKLASSSMRLVRPRADSASVNLIEDFPSKHVIIIADPKRLKQAFLNLLSNAVKFTTSNGSVTLSIKQDKMKKLVYAIVEDTGIGMSEKDIPKALSSFGQVDNKHSRKYEGTGLGLPLTKKLVELMNGKFIIKSKPGKGTTVTMVFKYRDTIIL